MSEADGYQLSDEGITKQIMRYNFKSHHSIITSLIILLFNFIIFAKVIFNYSQHYAISFVLGAFLLGILIMLYRHPINKQIKAYAFPLLLLAVIGLTFFYNGIYFSKRAYLAIGATFLLILPMLYYCWTRYNDNSKIYVSIAKGFWYSFIFFLIYSIVSGEAIQSGQYTSFLRNANGLGFYVTTVFNSLLYLNYKGKSVKGRIAWSVFAGIAFSFILFSGSRTSLLASLISLISYLLFTIVMEKRTFKIVASFIMSIILSFVIIPYLLAPMTLHFIGMPIFNLDFSTDTNINEKSTTGLAEDNFDSRLEVLQERFEKTVGDSQSWLERIDRMTSRRLGIWMEFYPEISFLGHADEYMEVKLVDKYYALTNAHNVYLQMAYSAGIPAGFSMILLMLLLLIKSTKEFIFGIYNKIVTAEVFFRFINIMTFFIVSLLSSTYLMYNYPPALSFWLIIYPFFYKSNKCAVEELESIQNNNYIK